MIPVLMALASVHLAFPEDYKLQYLSHNYLVIVFDTREHFGYDLKLLINSSGYSFLAKCSFMIKSK